MLGMKIWLNISDDEPLEKPKPKRRRVKHPKRKEEVASISERYPYPCTVIPPRKPKGDQHND